MSSILRLAVLAVLAAVLAATAIAFLPRDPDALRALVLGLGIGAPVVALAAWVVLTPAMFPGTLLAASAGLAFGAPLGAGIAWLGAVLGALMAFALARGVGRDPAERLIGDRLSRVRRLLERRGFAAVLLVRLAPGVPTTALHYAAGLSRVRTRHFAGAMAVGSALRTAPYALVGAGLAAGSPLGIGFAAGSVAVGAVAAAALAWWLRRTRAAAAAA